MKSSAETRALYNAQADELPISGPGLVDLMRPVLARGLPFRFRARGWSMAPFLRDGDVITIAPLGQKQARLGDVVALSGPEGDRMVVHRVVNKRGLVYQVQGDNLPGSPDGWYPSNALAGRVTRVERGGRYVSLGLGPERYLIAWMSRLGIFPALVRAKNRLFASKWGMGG